MIDRDRNALDEGDVVEDAAGLLWLVRNDGLNAARLAADRESVRNASRRRTERIRKSANLAEWCVFNISQSAVGTSL